MSRKKIEGEVKGGSERWRALSWKGAFCIFHENIYNRKLASETEIKKRASKKLKSLRKSVSAAYSVERNKTQTPKYLLRSISKENTKPPLAVNNQSSVIGTGRKPRARRIKRILSNGKYKSAEHRVRTTSTKSRVSIPMFTIPKPTEKIAPLPQAVEKDGIAHFREFVLADYMNNFLQIHTKAKKWIIDSSCSYHATSNDSLLLELCQHNGNQVIVTVDNSTYPVTNEGVVKINIDARTRGIKLNDVYHVPVLDNVSKIAVDVLFVCDKKGSLFVMSVEEAYAKKIRQTDSAAIWHARLGHLVPEENVQASDNDEYPVPNFSNSDGE
ncbi:hypothetical protein QQP08_022015 [Theobroma cacao]|nr:hypothetical protein QQP08_022015 [Theobroma cacao]